MGDERLKRGLPFNRGALWRYGLTNDQAIVGSKRAWNHGFEGQPANG